MRRLARPRAHSAPPAVSHNGTNAAAIFRGGCVARIASMFGFRAFSLAYVWNDVVARTRVHDCTANSAESRGKRPPSLNRIGRVIARKVVLSMESTLFNDNADLVAVSTHKLRTHNFAS